MSKTAIGTMGAKGAHRGAHVPPTELVAVFQIAPESWLISESPSAHTLIRRPRHHAVLGRQVLTDADRIANAVFDRVAVVVGAGNVAACTIGKSHG